jgi:hypothetical protein
MLEVDYPTRFGELIQSVRWDIELPIEWATYFEERGEASAVLVEQRHNQRLKVRTHGLLLVEHSLPFRARADEFVGTYTRDFSRHGCGFLTPCELFPEERVRIVLPTFWVQLLVMRCRRITSKCYESGGQLLFRHDPDPGAFVRNEDAELSVAAP